MIASRDVLHEPVPLGEGVDRVEITLKSGDVLYVEDHGDYVKISNSGRRISSGLSIQPIAYNVVEVRVPS